MFANIQCFFFVLTILVILIFLWIVHSLLISDWNRNQFIELSFSHKGSICTLNPQMLVKEIHKIIQGYIFSLLPLILIVSSVYFVSAVKWVEKKIEASPTLSKQLFYKYWNREKTVDTKCNLKLRINKKTWNTGF